MSKIMKELRELNSGANPERILKCDIASLEDGFLKDIEGQVYELTSCKSEVEYILNHRGTYGVCYKGQFYKQF